MSVTFNTQTMKYREDETDPWSPLTVHIDASVDAVVQDEEPTGSENVWFDTSDTTEVSVPTMTDFNTLKNSLKTGTFRIVVDTANVNKQITSSSITSGTLPTGDDTNTWFVIINTGSTRSQITNVYYDGGDLLITSTVAQAYYVRWFSWM